MGGVTLGYKRAGSRCVGAFDIDPEAVADHEYVTGERAQNVDFLTVSPAEIAAMHEECPDILAMSPPCVGFSGCLPEKLSKTDKYVALNSLVERSIWLALEAWPVPPKFIIMENVPKILSRGRKWLDAVQAMLRSYDYSCRETTHDCGELGGIAQHRRRFLMVARHVPQMGEPVHVPPRKRVLSIGEVFSDLPTPLPGSEAGGPLHALPKLSPLNWLRLALIPAGGDWRDLPSSVALESIRSGRQNGGFGVEDWVLPAHTVLGDADVRNTKSSVADPRVTCKPRATVYGVADSAVPSLTIVGAANMDNGPFSVADPRVECKRQEGGHGVRGWDQPSHCVIGEATIHNWSAGVADPRLAHETRKGNFFMHDFAQPSHTVIGDCRSYKGFNVADPRVPQLCGAPLDLSTKKARHIVIRAADGTWHRPMTTLELARLQGFPVTIGGDWLQLAGGSKKRHRKRIGNAVPPPAAEAIAREVIDALDASEENRFRLHACPVWVDGETTEVSA